MSIQDDGHPKPLTFPCGFQECQRLLSGQPLPPQRTWVSGKHPVSVPHRYCPGWLNTWVFPTLSPGKLSLEEGGSDTESLYEIEGLNKLIQFM